MPDRKLALLPLAFAVVGLSACTIIAGEPSGGAAPAESESTSESTEAVESASESESADGTGLEIPAEDLATAAADALEAQIGSRPDIDCGELDLTIFVDRQTYCTLIDAATGSEYEVTITVTGIDGEMFNFDVEVADTPK